MLSRISRISSLGAHLATGCSLFRDQPTTSRPVAKVDSSCRSISSKVSNSVRCSPEPVVWHDHENFLAELSDLEPLKNELSTSPTKTLADQLVPSLHDAEWNAILSNMEWIDKFEALDIPKIDSDCSSDLPEASSGCGSCDLFEKSATLIDWKAWNSYLGSDEEDMKPNGKPTIAQPSLTRGPISTPLEETIVKHEDDESSLKPSTHVVDITAEVKHDGEHTEFHLNSDDLVNNKLSEIEKAIIRGSGPLIWLPTVDEVIDKSIVDPSSVQKEKFSEYRSPKRRGVRMKPHSEEETNHRRFLNREAAFRYRERKRIEQKERKRELEYLIHRNSLLKEEVKKLHWEIDFWKRKLDDLSN